MVMPHSEEEHLEEEGGHVCPVWTRVYP